MSFSGVVSVEFGPLDVEANHLFWVDELRQRGGNCCMRTPTVPSVDNTTGRTSC